VGEVHFVLQKTQKKIERKPGLTIEGNGHWSQNGEQREVEKKNNSERGGRIKGRQRVKIPGGLGRGGGRG